MPWLDQLLTAFYTAKWQVTPDQAIYWREIVGNADSWIFVGSMLAAGLRG
ncbi:MAG: hypothetical protein ABW022_15085 [Actinoplanes sp.]